jgi:thiamine phosphate synthase YjbQ (UPF0047 family)
MAKGRRQTCQTLKFTRKPTSSHPGRNGHIDLSVKIQDEVKKSAIKNGIVHFFGTHVTSVLILTKNDGASRRL